MNEMGDRLVLVKTVGYQISQTFRLKRHVCIHFRSHQKVFEIFVQTLGLVMNAVRHRENTFTAHTYIHTHLILHACTNACKANDDSIYLSRKSGEMRERGLFIYKFKF